MAFKLKTIYNTLMQCNRKNCIQNLRIPILSSKLSYSSRCYEDKDPSDKFFSATVQDILTQITEVNIKKIHGRDALPTKSKLIFATDEELEERMAISMRNAQELMQMPPVVQVMKDDLKILSKDPAIQGAIQHRHVFTDISENINERDRLVVVRETTGVLRTANMDEKFRMSLIYNPSSNRFLKLVPLFKDREILQAAFDRNDHWFVLDFACHQFEPNYPVYHDITSAVYDHIYAHEHYEVLQSTRHFGPMAFYLAWNNKMEGLIVYFLNKDQIEKAASIINLHNIIHKDTELDMNLQSPVEKYVNILKEGALLLKEAKSTRIVMALQRYNEKRRKINELVEVDYMN